MRTKEPKSFTKIVGYSIPADLVQKLNARAVKENRSRSNMVSWMIRQYLKVNPAP